MDKASEEDDEQAFDQAPAPEGLEADQGDEGEEAAPNCEGIITDDPPEHWEDEFAPVKGRSRMEFSESRSDDPSEQGEHYLAKPRSFMNRPTTDWNGERKARNLVKPDEVRVGFSKTCVAIIDEAFSYRNWARRLSIFLRFLELVDREPSSKHQFKMTLVHRFHCETQPKRCV